MGEALTRGEASFLHACWPITSEIPEDVANLSADRVVREVLNYETALNKSDTRNLAILLQHASDIGKRALITCIILLT